VIESSFHDAKDGGYAVDVGSEADARETDKYPVAGSSDPEAVYGSV
jgi:hypothetical protein